jgi:hypothetical protein
MGHTVVGARDRGVNSCLGRIHNVWALKTGREYQKVGQREEELKKEKGS